LTPEQLETLRAGLPPFVEGTQPSALLAQYCRAYHLDFSAPRPEVEHSCGTVASGEFMLATHLWRQPGASANLFLVHGYFDHSGLFFQAG
jgi:lysophospholipase